MSSLSDDESDIEQGESQGEFRWLGEPVQLKKEELYSPEVPTNVEFYNGFVLKGVKFSVHDCIFVLCDNPDDLGRIEHCYEVVTPDGEKQQCVWLTWIYRARDIPRAPAVGKHEVFMSTHSQAVSVDSVQEVISVTTEKEFCTMLRGMIKDDSIDVESDIDGALKHIKEQEDIDTTTFFYYKRLFDHTANRQRLVKEWKGAKPSKNARKQRTKPTKPELDASAIEYIMQDDEEEDDIEADEDFKFGPARAKRRRTTRRGKHKSEDDEDMLSDDSELDRDLSQLNRKARDRNVFRQKRREQMQRKLIAKRNEEAYELRPTLLQMNERATETPADVEAGTEAAWQLAKSQLSLIRIPDKMPCRDEERATLRSFVTKALKSGGSQSAMYVAGVPGTGKTATVRQVIREVLQEQTTSGDRKLPKFDYLEVNALKLPSPKHAYSVLAHALLGKEMAPDTASAQLESYFSRPKLSTRCLILLLDELDYLRTRQQKVLYNLFNWPLQKKSRLIVIGVANTMDLPERLHERIRSRIGAQNRLHFESYKFPQLLDILRSRVSHNGKSLGVFEESALNLAARKVAAFSGDARACLELCRHAIDCRLEHGTRKSDEMSDELGDGGNKSDSEKNADDPFAEVASDNENEGGAETTEQEKQVFEVPPITIAEIQRAFKSLFVSDKVRAISHLAKFEKFVLTALALEYLSVGDRYVEFESLMSRLQMMSAQAHVSLLSRARVERLCRRLSNYGLVQMPKWSEDAAGARCELGDAPSSERSQNKAVPPVFAPLRLQALPGDVVLALCDKAGTPDELCGRFLQHAANMD